VVGVAGVLVFRYFGVSVFRGFGGSGFRGLGGWCEFWEEDF